MGKDDFTQFPPCSVQELDDLIASGALRDHAKELFLERMERTPGEDKWADAFLMVFFLPWSLDDLVPPLALRSDTHSSCPPGQGSQADCENRG